MSKRVLVSFALIFICLFSISAAWALDMDSSDLNKNIGTNLENNFNTDSNNNLDSNLNSNFNSNLNSNIDNSTQELDLSTKNFKALSSNSSIGGGQIALLI
ncbi:adhesin-like protein [Methanobrevibacter ruminantium M1]|uniref:Adhesin-like protein n=1 Tax=Methanobrevibacter ruminantium (strain ATCC 35063 / DSM 1093 / JCM 13430 / OCM 146 / M1) TaxID=634498 RepID=D3E2R6_METRM|nr:hypothetical protein [Methanobrevibacter ruminantium]ADC46827.1 adhesin-like protein [Methanobrevibacter ruminantium M1]